IKGRNTEFNIGKQIVHQATTNPELREQWKDDPNSRMYLTPKELLQFQMFMNQNLNRVKQITDVPVLFVQGFSDRLVKSEGTVELFRATGPREQDRVMIGNDEH